MATQGIYIAVIGPGGVGSIFLKQLSQLQKSHPLGAYIHLIAVQRSTAILRASNASTPLSLATWHQDLASSNTPPPNPTELTTWLASTFPPRRAVVIDTTSSSTVAESYPHFLRAGIHVVTANKKGFSSSQTLFDAIYSSAYSPLANPSSGLVYHESSVGAGMPILSTLRDLLASGDRVRKIEGVMSGSLSFLFNSFMPLNGPPPSSDFEGAKTSSWSDHVVEAQRLGYTEPDPRDDLSGLDVARKLVILARLAGVKIDGPEAFAVESLIPEALKGVGSGKEFLQGLPAFDGEMQRVREEVAAEGKVLRYVGSADLESGSLSVAMVRVGSESPFAGLSGSANVFSFWTERYADRPLVVQGAGAGGEVTAMGVTADLIKVIERIG